MPTPSSPGSSSTEILALGTESANMGCAAPGRVVRPAGRGQAPGPLEGGLRPPCPNHVTLQAPGGEGNLYCFLYKKVHQVEVRGVWGQMRVQNGVAGVAPAAL